ncbi:hypothetical protein AAHA92_06796 [Salvia divinorum]|uniref:Uncharacterized protein n=1 Tax=Salvia divinorum TaxID=28513 RepID=A0ABD1I6Y2_SALDI
MDSSPQISPFKSVVFPNLIPRLMRHLVNRLKK